jgi:hypothetical protein
MSTPEDRRSAGRQRVRPYAMTGGRTQAGRADLELEALVVITPPAGQHARMTVEQRAIAALCRDTLSIAEISARLNIPLGVIRILVSDMQDDGMVHVHRPIQAEQQTDLNLLERVLYGLRNI